jgi:predicted nucleic-acid-binding Zn-ribbon protein
MIKFNNDGCVKCGATVFSRDVTFKLRVHSTQKVDHLYVRCNRCGYAYYMHCADHPEHGSKEVLDRQTAHEEPVHGKEEDSK